MAETQTTRERQTDPTLIKALIALAYQYRDDMRHGVSELGARGRRLDAIAAVLAQVEGAQ